MRMKYVVWIQWGKSSPAFVFLTFAFKDVLKWLKSYKAEKVVPVPSKIIIEYVKEGEEK